MALWTHDGTQWRELPFHRQSMLGCAVICCNGPSFAQVDVSKLRGPGRCVIGINSVYPRLKPDWWIGMDAGSNHDRALFSEAFPKVLRGAFGNNQKLGDVLLRDFPSTMFFDIREKGHWSDVMRGEFANWNRNTFETAIQFALWLGYRDIAFVGVDLDTSKQDYADGTYLTDRHRRENQRLYDSQLELLKEMVEKAPSLGMRLVSCTPDSRINEFLPYRPLTDLYKLCVAESGFGKQVVHVREEWFDKEDRKYSGLYRDRNYPIGPVMETVRAFDLLPDNKVVDLGCGRGALAEYFTDYTGVDVSKWVVEDCRKRLARTFYHSSLHDLECLRGQQFDLAICSDVMEHIPPDKVDDVLAEIACVQATRFVFSIACFEARWKDDEGKNLHLTVQNAEWWKAAILKHFEMRESPRDEKDGRFEWMDWVASPTLRVECVSKVLQTSTSAS